MPPQQLNVFEVDIDLSNTSKLGISVVKQQNGWLVQRINPGPIDLWNRFLGPLSARAVRVGDRILSANGTPLLSGMEASDCLIDGRLLLRIEKGKSVFVEGRTGIIIWDAGREDSSFVKVRWIDAEEDIKENGLLRLKGQWKLISEKITNAFIGEPAVVDLSSKKLGDEGAEQVASILESSALSVMAVCLNQNNIRDHGATRIAEAIENSDVKQVDLFGNFFNKNIRDRIDELLWYRRLRLLLLTVYGAQDGAQILLSFVSLSGEETFEPLVMEPSDTIRNLRKALESKPEARKRHIELLLPAPRSRRLNETETVDQVLSREYCKLSHEILKLSSK